MEIQCSILTTSQFRIDPTVEVGTCFPYSFVLYDIKRDTDVLVVLLRRIYLEYLRQLRVTELPVSTSQRAVMSIGKLKVGGG